MHLTLILMLPLTLLLPEGEPENRFQPALLYSMIRSK
jgi:hypothetical protein